MSSKDSFYFSHDYNARNDRKIAPLVKKYRSAGYGIYLTAVEMLHEEQGCLDLDEITFSAIAKDLNEETELVKEVIIACIQEFKLFYLDENNCFSSNRVKRNLDKRTELSEKRSKSGKKGAIAKQELSNCQANAEQMPDNCQPIAQQNQAKERKGKEIKGKESIEEERPTFKMEAILGKTYKEYFAIMGKQAQKLDPLIFQQWKEFVEFVKDNGYHELFRCQFINPIDWGDMQISDHFPRKNWKTVVEAILASGVKPEHSLRFRIPQFQSYKSKELEELQPKIKKLVV